ncbi:MAG TPA: Wadjet anti-phage system protein JetD domain-containing protein [Chthoniobacteraceae bacterium]|nr:Wadjet anti-phage system protein JetD domain-containing protein [Chthoniobacteraceae bacterium]
MKADDPEWRKFPIFRAFFLQWRTARGAAEPAAFRKRFSRDWEELLRDAGLLSAIDRREAVWDARVLQGAGMLDLQTRSQRPEEILSVCLPLAAEPRLRLLFADELPQKAPAFDFTSVDWAPELAFLRDGGVLVAPEDLLRLNEFFRSGGAATELNLKERSLQIFGDEKRLDALRATTLLREDRLSLAALRCHLVAEPLGWQRGPRSTGRLLVVENACTWETYARWNHDAGLFSAIVYGGGNRFMDSVVRLCDLFAEVGAASRVFYFGDLDPQGLRIPRVASQAARRHGLPAIEPDLWSYQHLLAIGKPSPQSDPSEAAEVDLAWLGELREQAAALLKAGSRLAQENLHAQWLRGQQWVEPADRGAG